MSFRDDEIGYGKPPRWGRFRKGRSGNPNGRPRKVRAPASAIVADSASDDMLRRELTRKVRVKEGGKSQDLTMHEVILRSLTQTAAKGNPQAQREAIRLARELEQRDAARREAAEAEVQNTFDAMVRYQQRRASVWAEAAKTGTEPQEPWPHPDDVLLDYDMLTSRVRGPAHHGEVARFVYLQGRRDEFLARSVRERRRHHYRGGAITVWEFWMAYDTLLPRRWQILNNTDVSMRPLFLMGSDELDRHIEICAKAADRLERLARLPPHAADSKRAANTVLKPLLKQFGYRSLAQFERAFEEPCEAPV